MYLISYKQFFFINWEWTGNSIHGEEANLSSPYLNYLLSALLVHFTAIRGEH